MITVVAIFILTLTSYLSLGECLTCGIEREFGKQIEYYLTISGKETSVTARLDRYMATGDVHSLVCHE